MAGRWRIHRKPEPVTVVTTRSVPRRNLSRAEARTVRCPRCNAVAGDPCQGTNRPRKSNHIERVRLAEATAV
jgi:hypothetical protein